MATLTNGQYTILAATVAAASALTVVLVKDFFIANYFERKKEQRELQNIIRRYRGPILLAISELRGRMREFSEEFDSVQEYTTRKVLFKQVKKLESNDASDSHFQNYRLTSTLYRFCRFFAWIQLYREEVIFIDPYSLSSSKVLTIGEPMSEGDLNENANWQEWHDRLIFKEELKAVGEGMIETTSGKATIIGYNKFRDIISQTAQNSGPLWIEPVINFFTDLKSEKDFRKERFGIFTERLEDLFRSLDTKGYEEAFRKNR